ncbi:nuclear transport factor 2 family protein [Bradyrhizobium australafricanum]|uniref:nuclear transport factor 2 family protein n=1 Tax=Bradyrhizobium australafricanum TaxID=2821406 RepID=UPI001CE35914|nr:nuclear transport factor 2 family protein [Bradyrhizobium australafricanum]
MGAPETFDAMAIVVDLLDACRDRRISDLLDLYDEDTTVECCEGGRFEGRRALRSYWTLRLADQPPGPFQIEAIVPEDGGLPRVPRCRGTAVPDASPLERRRQDRALDLQSAGHQR